LLNNADIDAFAALMTAAKANEWIVTNSSLHTADWESIFYGQFAPREESHARSDL